jgi:transposase
MVREAEQLELAIETLESDQAERLTMASPEAASVVDSAIEAQKPARRPLPDHLPREEVFHPADHACPPCGGSARM